MPEITEVKKLQDKLKQAWEGQEITGIQAPPYSPNPTKYFQGPWPDFASTVLFNKIGSIYRIGKSLHVLFETRSEHVWQIQLMSTGWFMPGNAMAAQRCSGADPIYTNFLHPINPSTRRLTLSFDDGQQWDYHDPRTWGKWYLRMASQGAVEWGPDWISNEVRAQNELLAYRHRTRTVKEVLCDQKITAGLGNYMACEACFDAGIRPNRKWASLTPDEKMALKWAIPKLIQRCLASDDHSHWKVFKRRGEICLKCKESLIYYEKDPTGTRGSYYCSKCQV